MPFGSRLGSSLLVALWLTGVAPPATASLFVHRAWDPIVAGFGVPAPARRATAAPSVEVTLAHFNIYNGGVSDTEALLLDSEGTRIDLRYRRRLGCMTAAAEAGWLAYHGGVLDASIERWHGWLDLPNAGRESRENSLVRMWYRDTAGDTTLTRDVDRDVSGPADLFVSVQRPTRCDAGRDIWRLGLKLPVADADDWLGSGTLDAYADWQSAPVELTPSIRVGFAIGGLRSGESDFFTRQRRWVAYGAIGATWMRTEASRVFAQFDWHGPLFDSALRELGDTAGSLTVGHTLALPSGTLDLAISEDILVDTAPDITFHIGWRVGADAGTTPVRNQAATGSFTLPSSASNTSS